MKSCTAIPWLVVSVLEFPRSPEASLLTWCSGSVAPFMNWTCMGWNSSALCSVLRELELLVHELTLPHLDHPFKPLENRENLIIDTKWPCFRCRPFSSRYLTTQSCTKAQNTVGTGSTRECHVHEFHPNHPHLPGITITWITAPPHPYCHWHPCPASTVEVIPSRIPMRGFSAGVHSSVPRKPPRCRLRNNITLTKHLK